MLTNAIAQWIDPTTTSTSDFPSSPLGRLFFGKWKFSKDADHDSSSVAAVDEDRDTFQAMKDDRSSTSQVAKKETTSASDQLETVRSGTECGNTTTTCQHCDVRKKKTVTFQEHPDVVLLLDRRKPLKSSTKSGGDDDDFHVAIETEDEGEQDELWYSPAELQQFQKEYHESARQELLQSIPQPISQQWRELLSWSYQTGTQTRSTASSFRREDVVLSQAWKLAYAVYLQDRWSTKRHNSTTKKGESSWLWEDLSVVGMEHQLLSPQCRMDSIVRRRALRRAVTNLRSSTSSNDSRIAWISKRYSQPDEYFAQQKGRALGLSLLASRSTESSASAASTTITADTDSDPQGVTTKRVNCDDECNPHGLV